MSWTIQRCKSFNDRDFFAWTQQAAAALRAAGIPELDIEHVAEEIESMGRRDLLGVESRLVQIMEDKLKLARLEGILLEYNRRNWTASVLKQQKALARVLQQ